MGGNMLFRIIVGNGVISNYRNLKLKLLLERLPYSDFEENSVFRF